MTGALVILTFFIVVVIVSEYIKSCRVSLLLGMMFLFFSFLIIGTIRTDFSHEYDFEQFMSNISESQDSDIIECPQCKSKEVLIVLVGNQLSKDIDITIRCKKCKLCVNAESLKQVVSLWRSKKI